MKIRNGFVSNSSSSSFCILGKLYNGKEFENLTNGKNVDCFLDGDLCELTYRYGLSDYDCEDIIIGVRVDELNEKLTILKSKEKIMDKLKIFDKNIKIEDINFYTDGGFDG